MWWQAGGRESKKASEAPRSCSAGHSHSSTYNTSYGGSSLEHHIQVLINGLPKDLKKRNSTSGGEISSGDLCDLHRSLNHHLVDDILRLVKHEVTSHFRQLDTYPDLIEPMEAEILHRLRALKGLWTKTAPEGPGILRAWPCQINGCAACMLARIACDKETLRNLLIVIQSRTRTRKNHRPRELNIFVDHCINLFNSGEAEDLHSTASQLAFGMKRARKACVKAYMRDREDDPERSSKRKRRRYSRRADHVGRRRDPGIAFTTASEETLVIKPPLIPRPLTIYHLQDSGESQSSDSWDDYDENYRRRSEAPSPDSPCFKRAFRQPERLGWKVIFREIKWRNLARESEKVNMYQNLAEDNPYSRTTSAPEMMVDALGVRKARRYSESSLDLFKLAASDINGDSLAKENTMASVSVSDWTDDECETWDTNVSTRKEPAATDTT